MLPQLPHLKSQYWLSQFEAKFKLSNELQLVQECSERLAGVSSGDYVTFSKRNLPEKHQLYALLSNKWLSNEHINACSSYLIERLGCDSTIRIVNSFFLSKLAQIRQDNSILLPPASRQLNREIQSHLVHTLIIPVHLPNHWTLLVVNVLEQTYCYTNTLDLSAHTAPPGMIDNIEWWISGLIESPYALKPIPRRFKTSRQMDSTSCGVAVMTTMSHVILSTRKWSQEYASALRIEWFMKFTQPASANKVNDTVVQPSIIQGSESIDSDKQNTTAGSEISQANPPTVSTEPNMGPEEYRKLEHQRAMKRKAEDEALAELEEKIKEEKDLKRRQKEKEKKRRQRKNKKAKLAQEGDTSDTNSTIDSPPAASHTESDKPDCTASGLLLSHGIAEASRPHRQSKHILSGHITEESITEAKYMNWKNPIVFSLINDAAIAVGYPWSPAEIVKRLKLQNPQLFERLHPQRISDWKDGTVKDQLKWKDNVLTAVQSGNHPGGASTRLPLLAKYPGVVSVIKERLLGLRTAGTPLDTATVRGFMIGTISENAPELFECKLSKDKLFQCSSEFVRSFLHNELNWSIRRPTQTAQKVPTNVQEVLTHAFLRLACAVRDENIPSCCIVNSDQTQVVYSSGTQYTWHTVGDKQVPVLGKDKKRAFTLLVGVSNNGQLLPLQAIYQGLSDASLPHPSAPGYADALANHVFFVASLTATYWSTLQTMKDYVILILVPYFQHMILTHRLPNNQRCVWQIDVWSVHRSEKFRDWLTATYPWIILQYIPGRCTGLFQACDVGLQKIAKAVIHRKSLADIINKTTTALRNGADPATFVNDKTIGTLRNRSVSWINEAIRVLNKPELIRKAFALCAVPNTQFNLSYESLTSHEARQAIRELKTSNPQLHAEITAGRPVVPSKGDVEPKAEVPSVDELSSADHTRIVMGSATAIEVAANLKEVDQDSDNESAYEPSGSTSANPNPSHASESRPTRRELPQHAAKQNTSYALQEWWNSIDIDN